MPRECAGPCLWCGEYVTDGRRESGAQEADAGIGGHTRPSDAAKWKVVFDRVTYGEK